MASATATTTNHKEKINKLIKFCDENNIAGFAYELEEDKMNKQDYWSIVHFYQMEANADNNNTNLFFYSKHVNDRKGFMRRFNIN